MIDGVYRSIAAAASLLPVPWWPEPHGEGGPVAGLLHGASAGEVKAARAVLPALEAGGTPGRWELSTGTEAGLKAGATCRLPRDLPRYVDRFLDELQPRSLLLVEADLWPNLLRSASVRGIPIGVLGARVSERTAVRLATIPRTAARWLGRVGGFAAASEGDAARLRALGVPAERVAHTGWLKWPAPLEHDGDDGRLASELEIRFTPASQQAPLLVLGSVHPGEVRRLAADLRGTALAPGAARWLVVPRHPRREPSLAREARRICPPGWVSVDPRFGVLRRWYGLGDAAFVGGGARGLGVHDLLEPLQWGRRPLCHLDRGDPGAVGAVLVSRGLAHALDAGGRTGAPAHEAALLACTPASSAWDALRADRDGRARGVRFLQQCGVLGS